MLNKAAFLPNHDLAITCSTFRIEEFAKAEKVLRAAQVVTQYQQLPNDPFGRTVRRYEVPRLQVRGWKPT
jgi:hypothetical protein